VICRQIRLEADSRSCRRAPKFGAVSRGLHNRNNIWPTPGAIRPPLLERVAEARQQISEVAFGNSKPMSPRVIGFRRVTLVTGAIDVRAGAKVGAHR